MPNKYTAAGLDVARIAKKLLKKQSYHEPLSKARVRVDFVFVESTDGEDGAPVKLQGFPVPAVATIVPAKFRGDTKADGRVFIDKGTWKEMTEKQQTALVDEMLYTFAPVIREEVTVTDGNNRPKLKLRQHDFRVCGFSVIAREHGLNSQAVRAANALREHAADTFFPGFEFVAKPLPGARKGRKAAALALPAKQEGNVIDLSAQQEKTAAK